MQQSKSRELGQQFGGSQFSGAVELPDGPEFSQPNFGTPRSSSVRAPFHAAMPIRAPRDTFSKILPSGLIPAVAHGRAYEPTAGKWNRVVYPKPIKGATPIAVTHYRAARFVTRSLTAVQTLSTRTVQHVTLPRVDRDDFRYKGYNAVNDSIKGYLGDWGLLNWARDWVAAGCAWVGWFIGGVLNWIWDTFLGPRFNDFNSKIDTLQDVINSQLIDQFNNLIGTINNRITAANDAFSKQIDDLYKGIGLPNGISITLVQVSDVSDTGFSWLSQGDQTIYWVAFGE